MSGVGVPDLRVDGRGQRVGVVAAQWHDEVMVGLLAGAMKAIAESGAEADVIRVPGAFELPTGAAILARDAVDAIVALGVVIRGSTPHFEYVCRAATDGLMSVGLESGIPVGFGLLTCDDETQALDRAGLPGSREDKGREAAHVAMSMAVLIRDRRAPGPLGFAG